MLSLAAENGWHWCNELETTYPGNGLAGAAIGMRGYMFKGAYYDVFVGRPLVKPEGFVTSEIAGGFSLNCQF